MISAYPKIFTLGQKYISNIFEDEVFVEEKCDGSQWGFAKIDGEMIYRSKGKRQMPECPDKLFKDGIDYIESIKHCIPNNYIFYAEYLKKPKHNTLTYDRIPKNHFMLFGIQKADTQEFIFDRKILQEFADGLDIDLVPLLYHGKINNAEEIKKFLETESYLGRTKVEGVVIKNYKKDLLLGGQIIPIMCGKYVSEEFKEVHQKNWSKENTVGGKWESFKEKYHTEARWLKAIFYLRDQEQLEDSPRDIGKLMKRITDDITEECQEEIKTFLWNQWGKELLRNSQRGFPEFYKKYLLDKSFEEVKDV